MHVVTNGLEVAVTAVVYQQRFIAAAEQVSKDPVLAVETGCVSSQKPFHAVGKIGLGCFHDEVKMIGHQAVGMNLPIGLGAGFRQCCEKHSAIDVIQENGFPPVAATHQMIYCTRILQAKLSSHAKRLPQPALPCQSKMQ